MPTGSTWSSHCALTNAESFAVQSFFVRSSGCVLLCLVLAKATLLLSISNRLATAVLVRNVEVDGVAIDDAAACLAGGSAAKAAGALANISGNAEATRSRTMLRVIGHLPPT